ncbi:MAG TPA: hypothetical protein VEP29_00095, partial [Desulfatiglandales bacterium]|nr:hypothetical protein [Desulfatiglandales bacterium]
MERRVFLVRLAAISAGLIALLKGTAAWTKGLPSDPGAAPAGTSGPDTVSLAPFEKTNGFA